MQDLANWAGLSNSPTLSESTFNGIPYVVTRDGVSWSGRRPQQAERRSANLSVNDRALLFAQFYEDFVEWSYPCPAIFRHRTVRSIVFLALFLLPTKMEITASRAIFQRQMLPSLHRRDIMSAIRSLFGLLYCRLQIVALITPAFMRRCIAKPDVLHIHFAQRRTLVTELAELKSFEPEVKEL